MLRKTICFLLLASAAHAGSATFSQVNQAATYTNIQHTSGGAYTFTDSLAFGGNVTAHSLLVVGCVANSMTANTLNVSDNNSNVYSTATIVNDSISARRTGVWYVLNANAGATTITCVDTSHVAGVIQQSIHEYGSNGAGIFDVATSSTPVGATANPAATPLTTTAANEFVFAFTSDNGSATGQSGTLRENYVNNTWQSSEDTIVASPGSYTSTFTSVVGGSPWTMIQAAFK
jgi:hypothetical protein